MSNSIEDKISLFTKVIIERIELDCKQKEKKVAEYFENRKAKIINEQEEQKSNSVEKATKAAESKKQRLILKTQSDLHLDVLKKKREFTERLTDEARYAGYPSSAGISSSLPEISLKASAHLEVESAITATLYPISLKYSAMVMPV